MMIQLKMLSCCPCLPGLGLPMIKTCLQSPILLFAIRETDGNDDDDDGGGFHLSHERRDHVTNLVKKNRRNETLYGQCDNRDDHSQLSSCG